MENSSVSEIGGETAGGGDSSVNNFMFQGNSSSSQNLNSHSNAVGHSNAADHSNAGLNSANGLALNQAQAQAPNGQNSQFQGYSNQYNYYPDEANEQLQHDDFNQNFVDFQQQQQYIDNWRLQLSEEDRAHVIGSL